ncbi:MAG: bifunctional glutamate N-acetyltransferase/amino-acid acetyltransferase ArgJ [Deltaproteobacteria bacterium]|nr:bifunctional glutamate N-acetyltransferase/amino-acid acetyltransferase ArgJ [Deltaproteobacteria bacterium]MBW2582503.1 bifunctional glutamate N-acetyltransferase/amino-acid acetyltransferase ArgJ [Deltaproteobacteria bacterium]
MDCPGFQTAGVASGLKKNGKKDLGLIYSEVPATVAAMFTRNLVKAAPVFLDQQRTANGSCRAIIVNSGNANCCTGEQGMLDAIRMGRLAAQELMVDEEDVLVASTGVIGEPLPVEKIESAAPGLIKALAADGLSDFAEAIMTTDTVAKVVSRRGELAGKSFTVSGAIKGAGMIRPDMATMLCFVMTDIVAQPQVLQQTLNKAVDRSLNRMTVDGDTSTNDTVLLMANGHSTVKVISENQKDVFQAVLNEVMIGLAKWLIKDAEGATKLVEIVVKGAKTKAEAHKIADTVANSPLFKTALFGEDANWGRILAAVGRSGITVDPEKIDIFFGSAQMVKSGFGCGKEAEAEATRVLKQDEFTVTIDLNLGPEAETVFTCDFSIDYVKINADYRT